MNIINYLDDPFITTILGTLISFGAIFIAILLSPWFSWFDNALSDLGNYNNGLPAAIVFNMGLIFGGLIITITAILLLFKINDIPTRVGFIIFMGSSIFLLLIGVFSENFGHLHSIVAVGFFLSFPFAMWAIGLSWLRFSRLRPFSIFSILLPFVSFYLWDLTYNGTPIWSNVAIPELLTASTLILWLLIITYLFRTHQLTIITKG